MQQILRWKLQILARWYLRKYKPMIIGVTGNAGKTSTKEAIGAVVQKIKTVRVSGGNLNNEFGLPLTILGNWDQEYYNRGPSLGFWFKVLWISFIKLLTETKYPEVLVLEYGADHPDDIKKLASLYKPHISVVTTVGDVPVHIEYFKDADAVADEKSNLVKVLQKSDVAILNHDDHRVLKMQSKTQARVMTYGFEEGANVRASDAEFISNEEGRPLGVSFKLNYLAPDSQAGAANFVPVRIEGSLGKSQAWSAAAAGAVGISLGMNLLEVSEALHSYHAPKGRLNILEGIKKSHIIDDTYNASPASMRLALDTLCDVPSIRKIAVLGDMLELGEHTEQAHIAIGKRAAEVADILVCVGARAKFIAEAASEQGRASTETSRSNVLQILNFDTSEDAKLKIQELIREHDLVLVKGSQGIRMEKIVEEIMAHPERSKDLLVRQSNRWKLK